jgi:hypothetical protein
VRENFLSNLPLMKTRIRFFCFLFMLHVFAATMLPAQDLTGIWRGHFRSNDGLEHLMGNNDDRPKYDDRYKMEVQIAQTNNHFEAVTYSYRSSEFYGKAEASGSVNTQTKKVLLKEGKLLEVRFASGFVCIMTCFFQYTKLGNDEYLQGTYYSTNVTDSSACGKGSIFLHRVTETDFHKEPFLEKKEKELLAHKKLPAPKKAVTEPPLLTANNADSKTSAAKKPVVPAVKKPIASKAPALAAKPVPKPKTAVDRSVAAQKKSTILIPEQAHNTRDSSIKITQPKMPVSIPEVLKTRANELMKTLTVNHSTIELRIYDDGAIDNDTVSVYYDNKLILSKARLTDQPITLQIKVEPSDQPHQLVMVAENLGEIPPNTSLLVVRDGEKKYEERIISTEQKNVQLNFIYKKIE